MKSVLDLSLRYIKAQKRHSVFIAVCVMLSVALTSFFLTLFTSVKETLRESTLAASGSWEALITGITPSQAEELSHNAAFSETEQIHLRTYSNINETGMERSIDVYIKTDNEAAPTEERYVGTDHFIVSDSEQLMFKGENIIKGAYPQSPDEIALPPGTGLALGQRITAVKQLKRPLYDEDGRFTGYEILETTEKEYTVCGFKDEDFLANATAVIHPDDDFLCGEHFTEYSALAVRFSDPDTHIRSTLMELVEASGGQVDRYFTSDRGTPYLNGGQTFVFENTDLLMTEAVGKEARSGLIVEMALMYIVVLIILISSRMIIDCEFELTAAKKQKQMGLLMSIGADDEQLISVMTLEGIILGIIAVPLGLLLGVGIAALIREYLMTKGGVDLLLSNADGVILTVSPLCMLLAAVTGIGWVFFSAYGTAVRIRKVNPVEAVKGYKKHGQSPYPPVKKSAETSKQLMTRLVTGAVRSERKRFISTIISLTLSMTLAVGITYITEVGGNAFILMNRMWRGTDDPNGYFRITRHMSNNDEKQLTERLIAAGYFKPYDEDALYEYLEIMGTKEHKGNIYLQNTFQTITPIEKEEYYKLFPQANMTYEEFSAGKYLLCFDYNDRDCEGTELRDLGKNSLSIMYCNDVPVCRMDSEQTPYTELNVLLYLKEGKYPEYDSEALSTFIIDSEKDTKERLYIRGFVSRENFSETVSMIYKQFPDLDSVVVYRALTFFLEDTAYYDDAVKWLDENIYVYEDAYNYTDSVKAAISLIKTIGAAIIAVSALIAISNVVNITVSCITENRQGYALLRAAGMTDSTLEETALRQAVQPIKTAAVITAILSALIVTAVHLIMTRGGTDITPETIAEYGFVTADIPLAAVCYVTAVVAAAAVSFLSAVLPLREFEEKSVADEVRVTDQ